VPKKQRDELAALLRRLRDLDRDAFAAFVALLRNRVTQ
jgi:hypothetical protein